MAHTTPAVRPRLNEANVVDAAEQLVARDGWQALTMAALAGELAVRPPALYRHVASLDELRHMLQLRVIEGLARAVRAAAMGRSGVDGLHALGHAYRSFAQAHAHLIMGAAEFDDPSIRAAVQEAGEAAHAVLASFGLHGSDIALATAQLAVVLHGFVVLEVQGGLEWVDPDAAFDGLLDMLATAFRSNASETPRSE